MLGIADGQASVWVVLRVSMVRDEGGEVMAEDER